MTERVLSCRELNRALLARQLLLGRSSLPLPQALEALAGLQTQYAPSAYVGLWSRLSGFEREDLTRALEERWVVQATLMRSTIHTVSAADFPLFAAGLRSGRRDWWRRVQGGQAQGLDMETVAALLRPRLARGPARAAELKELLRVAGVPAFAWQGVGLWLDLVRVPPSGTWEQRRADLYGLAEDWLGASRAAEAAGLVHLVRRYLGAFGPAPLNDVASWAGLAVSKLIPALEGLTLSRYRDESGGVLLDLPGAPLPGPDAPAPVRFLPTWDATLLVHVRRTQILPEVYRPHVFQVRNPQSVCTFLVDGAVAGTWRHEGSRVRLEPFEPLPRPTLRELDAEAHRLAAFHAP